MEDLKSKLIATIKTAIQPDIEKWVLPADNHVVNFDIKPNGALWSFRDDGVHPLNATPYRLYVKANILKLNTTQLQNISSRNMVIFS